MDDLSLCPVCHRHIKGADAVCPFCRSPFTALRTLSIVGAAVLGVGLCAACYGPPPGPQDGIGGTGGGAGGASNASLGADAADDASATDASVTANGIDGG